MPFTTFVYGHGASPQVACCTRRVFRSVARTDAPQGTRPSARRVTIVASGPFASQRALGVSPIELAQTHRLLLAKQLLTETSLPITRVAFDSGFASVRRFNALFRSRYRLTPSDLQIGRASCREREQISGSAAYSLKKRDVEGHSYRI